ncbi:leucyl aminopeptidase [Pelosinus propionicus]|uniref:Probable cytosol aminopeptidase n=1 Tax=Pelosinus propionicus DSM 13327 TaxID=1123291 RepID=A0A1I4HAM4_9FIRM|nr:leucyl aminopeptidase [Pelosinus propionicus]SFL39318.1 leucyl aminopeptidase [Pelosinus propionicus DSM 13327]
MKIATIDKSIIKISCDTLIINVYKNIKDTTPIVDILDQALSNYISSIILAQPNCSDFGETTIIYTLGAIEAKHIILVGIGNKEELTTDKIRSAAAIAIRAAKKIHSSSIAFRPSDLLTRTNDFQMVTQAIVEGALLGAYQFDHYKTKNMTPMPLNSLFLIESNSNNITAIQKGIHIGSIIGPSVNFARDLVNHPSQYMTPSKMAAHAQEISKKYNLELLILEKEDMICEKMHALLSVSQGSIQPPKMIILKYIGDPANKYLTAFVGKGVTFDSGGISIKPSLNMSEMKDDMAGGAAVLGAMAAIGQLKPKVNIIGVIPCVENMPSGKAYKPGDVIYSMSGKTIEIITTDAEGRLILADAITYANKLGATHIIDIATLTGACVVALGNVASGIMTNDATLCRQVLQAAAETGEKMWELPNFSEYKKDIQSNIADLKNSGGRMAGAITAGSFIEEFVENASWVHIDIAGTANVEKDDGYILKGGTGVGTRTLIQLAQNMSQI